MRRSQGRAVRGDGAPCQASPETVSIWSMRTYPHPVGGWARGLRLLAGLVLLVACVHPAAAQQRNYLVELGAAGAYQSFDSELGLGGSAGGIGRVGLWLPLHFSLEAEG